MLAKLEVMEDSMARVIVSKIQLGNKHITYGWKHQTQW